MRVKAASCCLTAMAFLAIAAPSMGGDAAPRAELVMQTSDPWLMVIGSDSPEFAMYSDGTVIFARESNKEDKPAEFYSVQIPLEERAQLMQEAQAALRNKKPRYILIRATDQPLSTVALPPNNSETVSVYGRPFRKGPSTPTMIPPSKGLPPADVLAPDLKALMKRMHDFDRKDATRWLPDKVEVMVWPYSYAKNKPVEWPKTWPDFNSPDTKKRQTDSYSVFIPSTDFPQLQKLIRDLPDKTPVSINGKLMAISYRFPFPDQTAIRISLTQKAEPRTKPSRSF